jgi:hypothetical protein
MAWLTKPRFAGTVLTAQQQHGVLLPCGLRSHRLRDMSFAPKPKIPLRGYRAYSPAAARSAAALWSALTSLARYELRPKAQDPASRVPCLQPGRCTQRLGFVRFLVCVHIGYANMNSAQKPMPC